MRQRREQQQIALATIAEQTKIKQSLLEELERDDVSHWPSGIFRRAFVRAYARAIGLEADAVVREFLSLYPDPNEAGPPLPAIASAIEGSRASAGPTTRLRDFVGSALESLSRRRPAVIEQAAALPEELHVSCAPAEPEGPAEPDASAEPSTPPAPAVPAGPDLVAVAQLCTGFARADEATDVAPLLRETARLLDAVGLIVWAWDPVGAELRALLAHGYSDTLLAHLPAVTRDADNATAAAFRSGQACAVSGRDRSGALVVPLMTSAGCAGVLAIELQCGRKDDASRRALATIVAAQLAAWIGPSRSADVAERRLA